MILGLLIRLAFPALLWLTSLAYIDLVGVATDSAGPSGGYMMWYDIRKIIYTIIGAAITAAMLVLMWSDHDFDRPLIAIAFWWLLNIANGICYAVAMLQLGLLSLMFSIVVLTAPLYGLPVLLIYMILVAPVAYAIMSS